MLLVATTPQPWPRTARWLAQRGWQNRSQHWRRSRIAWKLV